MTTHRLPPIVDEKTHTQFGELGNVCTLARLPQFAVRCLSMRLFQPIKLGIIKSIIVHDFWDDFRHASTGKHVVMSSLGPQKTRAWSEGFRTCFIADFPIDMLLDIKSVGSPFVSASCFFMLQLRFPQEPRSNTFDRCVNYGSGFKALNEELVKGRERFEELVTRFDSITRRLMEANRDIQVIESQSLQRLRTEIELMLRARQTQAITEADAKIDHGANLNLINRLAFASQAMVDQGNRINLQQEVTQLGIAQRATAERWLKLLSQLQDTQRQIQECQAEEKRITDAYIRQSDLSGTRSRIELRAAQRMLDASSNDNVGARLAKAITYARLGDLDAATALLQNLNQSPLPYSAIALAARVELAASNAGPKATREEQRMLTSVPDPTVLYFRARTAALLQNYGESLKLCERLLKVEAYQTQSLVLSSLANSHPDNKDAKPLKSLEHAQLASDLTSGRDWYATIALALAYAAHKEPDKALKTADQAIELSIGDMRERCIDLRNSLANGQPAKWKF